MKVIVATTFSIHRAAANAADSTATNGFSG
jgi:hypothetical protein